MAVPDVEREERRGRERALQQQNESLITVCPIAKSWAGREERPVCL